MHQPEYLPAKLCRRKPVAKSRLALHCREQLQTRGITYFRVVPEANDRHRRSPRKPPPPSPQISVVVGLTPRCSVDLLGVGLDAEMVYRGLDPNFPLAKQPTKNDRVRPVRCPIAYPVRARQGPVCFENVALDFFIRDHHLSPNHRVARRKNKTT